MKPLEVSTTPRAAYLHVPFCRRRCGYCNFTLIAGRDDLIQDYLRALQLELEQLGEPREVETIFVGGGTPSHLPPAALQKLLALINHWFPLRANGEFSVEANPEDIDDARLSALQAGKVTRISLGVQSFDEPKLRSLEREHSGDQAREALHRAMEFGFEVSLDLIFAAPQETLEIWRRDVEQAIALRPGHISTYGLTFDQGAAFWSRRNRGQLRQVADSLEAEMYELGIDRLTAAGYEHYEVSNFARPGRRCRHNETYWLGYPYYAAGPGASRFLDGVRETNHRSTTTYLRRVLQGESPVAEVDRIPAEARLRERFVFALRRMEGVDCDWFEQETGVDPRRLFAETLQQQVALGLLEIRDPMVRLTRRGLLISDSVMSELL